MEQTPAKSDLITISLRLAATPAIQFIPGREKALPAPELLLDKAGDFIIHLELALQYQSLSEVVTGYLANRRFDIADGLIKKHVIIRTCTVTAGERNNLALAVRFSGSHNGVVHFSGKPVYNNDKKTVTLQEFDYDLQTNDFLLKAAGWLFDKRIVSEMKKRTNIDVAPYYKKAEQAIHAGLNKEWIRGITGTGGAINLQLTSVTAMEQHLSLQMVCTGQLGITVAGQK